MKKFIAFLMFAFLSVIYLQAQERTVNLYPNGILDLNNVQVVGYAGATLDRLVPTTRDTIDYYIQVKNQSADPLHFYIAFQLDTIAGADTTVAITVQYKKFSGESYSDLIASAVASAVSAQVIVVKTSLGVTTEYTETGSQASSSVASHNTVTTTFNVSGYDETTTDVDTLIYPAITNVEAAQTITNGALTTTNLANTALYYGWLRFRFILQGNDHVGTGIKIERIDLQFYN